MTPDDHKIVQLAGDSKPVNDKYVGKMFETTVDKDNWAIRLHDGVTPGGHEILNLDSLVELFQARSTELDGLLGFKDQDRGFLARLGPATYRLRTVTVNGDELTIGFGNGYGGNPLIGLAAEIKTDHTASGTWTFSKQIIGTGGFKGNVEGDTVGTHTGDVLGNVTGDLTGNSNGHHTGSQTGDVDVRGHTLLLDDGQIHLAALNADVIEAILEASARVGSILIWSGSLDSVPAGWAICDGANGTPDLRDRFVVGAGLNYNPAAIGGSATSQANITINGGGGGEIDVTVAGHSLTVDELAAHTHNDGIVDDLAGLGNRFIHGHVPYTGGGIASIKDGHANDANSEGITSSTGAGTAHTHDGSSAILPNHTHAVTVGDQESLPPYYALAYIMRIQ